MPEPKSEPSTDTAATKTAAAGKTSDVATEPFRIAGFYGETSVALRPLDLERDVQRLIDPASADETIHWGRNYLYRTHLETASGRHAVVVKQFRNQGRAARLRRRTKGSKALASWTMAKAFVEAGIPTATPALLIESEEPDGASFFVTEHLPDMLEARYIFRAVNGETLASDFPQLDYAAFLDALGQALRRMHDHGLFHRDLSIGNVLLPQPVAPRVLKPDDLAIIDLNRGRRLQRLSTTQRMRDLCRLAIFRPEDQERFLSAYWGDALDAGKRRLFQLYHRGFLFKIEGKKKVRARLKGLLAPFKPRRAHVHIPDAPKDAATKDKIVWDYLSDQPHQHAGRYEKLLVRLADAPSHLRHTLVCLSAAPRIWKRYKTLKRQLHQEAMPWQGAGVCVRPYPANPEALLAAIDDLGVEHVLLRLHPWESDHSHEQDLAAELHRRGYELAFSLPQNRDLVRDPARWRQSIEELAETFVPYGRHFQVGQAINRSKWGVWKYGEYLELAAAASEVLRPYPDVEILGPAVIDFEPYAMAGVLNRPHSEVHFDAAASLLYVDRRGAPENLQLGFDSIGKAQLVKAIADTAKHCQPRSWITEVNWPLWEGPHSPAGRSVSVDEASQANFLARFYLLVLCSGAAERVYWWQMIARGYGLIAPGEGSGKDLRRRPSFLALATLQKTLCGCRFESPVASPEGTYLYAFQGEDGEALIVGWSRQGERRISLPHPSSRITEQDGTSSKSSEVQEVTVGEAVRYFHL